MLLSQEETNMKYVNAVKIIAALSSYEKGTNAATVKFVNGSFIDSDKNYVVPLAVTMTSTSSS